MTMTATDTPRIYLTCLASYNAGRLIGEWVDCTDIDEVEEARARVSAAAVAAAKREGEYPVYFGEPEEFFITDYENFGGYNVGEYEQLDKLAELGAAIEENGEAFSAYLSLGRDADDADISDLVASFQESYCGQYDSMKDYAREYVAECGLGGVPAGELELDTGRFNRIKINVLDELDSYLDWDTIAREMENDFSEADGGYIFRD